jgi:UDP-N-acetylglucosamine 4-epimerase
VRVVDDLSNGYYENIAEFVGHPKFEFLKGDICDYSVCVEAMRGIHKVTHQAALGSVPRSIENPSRTNEVNVGGTVNILHAAKSAGVGRVVLAFSSSTYGDSPELPKVEERIGRPLSPYAVSKYAAELYARGICPHLRIAFCRPPVLSIFLAPAKMPITRMQRLSRYFAKPLSKTAAARILMAMAAPAATSPTWRMRLHANDLALFTDQPGRP